MKYFSLVTVLLLTCTATTFAQYTNALENSTTQAVVSVWDLAGEDIVVGSLSSNNVLTISGAAAVTNNNTTIGGSSNSISNLVQVEGNGVSWVNTGTLILAEGSNNTVSVSDGAAVTAGSLSVDAGNAVNLNEGGKLAITGEFNLDAQSNLNWNAGGHLSVGGELTKSNGLDGVGRTLSVDGGSWTNGTDLTIEGTSNTVNIVNGGWVTNDNGYVIGTNNAVVVSGTGSSWQNNGGLFISGSSNNVTVSGGGTITADTLSIDDDNDFNLNSGGKLAITGEFNVDAQTNLNWITGGHLSVGGELTKSNGMDGVGQILSIDGGSWNPGTDLTIAGTSNTFNIVNGGGVTNDNGNVIGTNNAVAVSGTGSSWQNNGELSITGSSNNVTVSDGGTITADALSIDDDNDFNLNSGGTLAMTGDFNVSTHSNLNWESGGHLSVGGDLTGFVASNDAVYLSGARDLTLNGGSWATGANNLTVELGSALMASNNAWVYVGEVSTNDLVGSPLGGIAVASANGAELIVDNGSSVETTQGLYVGGTNSGMIGTVTVTNNSTITADSLTIETGSAFNLNEGGKLAITGNFNVDAQTNLNWNTGGHLLVGDELTKSNGMDGVGQILSIDGGSWTPGSDLTIEGTSNTFNIVNGGGVTNDNGYVAGSNNTVSVSGTGSSWQNNGDLYIGFASSTNGLEILSGGEVTTTVSGYIGNMNGTGNYVLVSGSYSVWNVGGNLNVGNGGTNNSMVVANGGQVGVDVDLLLGANNRVEVYADSLVSVGRDMTVSSNTALRGDGQIVFTGNDTVLSFDGAGIELDQTLRFEAQGSGSQVDVNSGILTIIGSTSNRFQSFESLNLTNSTLEGFGTVDSFDSVKMSGGVISPAGTNSAFARLEIDGDFAASGGITYSAQINGDQNDELVFTNSSPVDLSDITFEIVVFAAPTGLTSSIISADTNFTGEITSSTITDYMLLRDAVLGVEGNDVTVDIVTHGTKFSSALTHAELESVRAGFNSMKGSVFARTKQLRRNMAATPQALSRDAYLLSAPGTPEGPQGPGDDNTIFDMNVWMQQYSGQGDFDAAGESYGYRLNNNGTTFGVDKVIGDGLVAGLNYTYARSAARTTNADRLDSETYWVGAYAEWVGEDGLYVDALAAWGRSNFDSERVEGIYRGLSSYRGYNIGAYADVGQYYHHKNLALSPYAGLHFLSSQSEEHTETEVTAGGETFVSKQDHTWLEAVLGLKLRHRLDTDQGRFQTTAYAEYAHDVIQEDVYATLAATGLAARNMARVTPDADVVNVGAGISWICTDALEIGVGYNGRFSDQYEEHTTSAMLNVRF